MMIVYSNISVNNHSIPIIPTENASSHPLCERINLYIVKNDSYTVIIEGYEGIPQNLVINLLAWLILVIIFVVIRKKAGDYGRLALVSREEERWPSLFYGRSEMESLNRDESFDNVGLSVDIQNKGMCNWIPNFFRLNDNDFHQKCGPDAVQYLSFQRHLLFYTIVVTLLSLAFALPVNFWGNLKSRDTQQFGTSTISNIDNETGKSGSLWVHIILSVVFLIFAVVLMRRFSRSLRFEKDDTTSRTLMIIGIPRTQCIRTVLLSHFNESYPDFLVTDIQFAYNIRKLIELDKKGRAAADALIYSETHLENETTGRPRLVPHPCGRCLCCCGQCGCEEVDTINYYSHVMLHYRALCREERENAFSKPVGIAFVTFATKHQAQAVLKNYRRRFCKGKRSPRYTSSRSHVLKTHNWDVQFAPSPDDIYWENLPLRRFYWWFKAGVINLCVFSFVFFMTTPAYVIDLLKTIDYQRKFSELHLTLVTRMLPSLIMWIVSALLPLLVYYSDQLIGHWTKTGCHIWVMAKTYGFLIIMVLILPSLGITSLPKFLQWLFPSVVGKNSQEEVFRQWQCIFMPDNGSFFVNYVITSALLGSALELIRLPELFFYGIRFLFARSNAEKSAVRKSVLWEFQFGLSYAWLLCVFATIITNSLLCPLITPFGVLYLLLKHLVDRYNIYYVYTPSRIDKRVHKLAIFVMMISVIFLQVNIAAFMVIRFGLFHYFTIVSSIILLISLVSLICQAFAGILTKFGPVFITQTGREEGTLVSMVPTAGSSSDNNMESDSSYSRFLPEILHDTLHQPLWGHQSNETNSERAPRIFGGETMVKYFSDAAPTHPESESNNESDPDDFPPLYDESSDVLLNPGSVNLAFYDDLDSDLD